MTAAKELSIEQVQALIDINTKCVGMAEMVDTARSAGLPSDVVPSWVSVRLDNYYPYSELSDHVFYVDQVLFETLDVKTRLYGTRRNYVSYSVDDINAKLARLGGDSLAPIKGELYDKTGIYG